MRSGVCCARARATGARAASVGRVAPARFGCVSHGSAPAADGWRAGSTPSAAPASLTAVPIMRAPWRSCAGRCPAITCRRRRAAPSGTPGYSTALTNTAFARQRAPGQARHLLAADPERHDRRRHAQAAHAGFGQQLARSASDVAACRSARRLSPSLAADDAQRFAARRPPAPARAHSRTCAGPRYSCSWRLTAREALATKPPFAAKVFENAPITRSTLPSMRLLAQAAARRPAPSRRGRAPRRPAGSRCIRGTGAASAAGRDNRSPC